MIFSLYFSSLLVLLFVLFIRSWKFIRAYFSKLSFIDGFIIFGLMMIGAFLRMEGTDHIDLDPYGWGFVIDALSIKGAFLSQALHVPGYAFFISLPLMISKDLALVSHYIIVFSVLTIGLVYLLAFLITEDRITAIFSAVLLLISKLAIQYSGQEIPITCSVFFTAGAFLAFILWLKTREVAVGELAVVAFFVSFNIKSENTIFLILLLLFVLFNHKKALVVFLALLSIISLFVWAPFIRDGLHAQLVTWSDFHGNYAEPYGIKNFFAHCRFLIIGQYHFLPILIAVGFALLRANSIILCWFCMTLLYFLWYSDYCAALNMLQVLIPVYIMGGCILSKVLGLFINQQVLKYAALIICLMLLFFNFMRVYEQKPYSWIDLKNDLPKTSNADCIISPNRPFTGFALSFIFPDRRWIFTRDKEASKALSQCLGKVYYFDPAPYGLEGEVPLQDRAEWDSFMKDNVSVLGDRYRGMLLPVKHQ